MKQINYKEKLFNLKCKATGIGSVPHADVGGISDLIIRRCPNIPYWPQCINIDARESMLLQFTENLPCVKIENNNVILDRSIKRDGKLLEFFENLTAKNYEYFKISREFAGGFYTFLEKIKRSDISFAKGQVVGPVTFMCGIIDENGKSILFDDELCDAIIRGLAMKGVWQAKEIKKTGKMPVLFFDEPAMAGFGSAFMPLGRDQAVNIFDKLIDTVREHEDVIIGIHICGNSDWETILGTKIDILNFDAFAYMQNFLLYSDAIKRFLERDGIIAWGAVPTSDYNDKISLDIIIKNIENAVNTLVKKGIGRDYLLKRSLYTPACGMGKLGRENAEKIIDLTYSLALYYTNHF